MLPADVSRVKGECECVYVRVCVSIKHNDAHVLFT